MVVRDRLRTAQCLKLGHDRGLQRVSADSDVCGVASAMASRCCASDALRMFKPARCNQLHCRTIGPNILAWCKKRSASAATASRLPPQRSST